MIRAVLIAAGLLATTSAHANVVIATDAPPPPSPPLEHRTPAPELGPARDGTLGCGLGLGGIFVDGTYRLAASFGLAWSHGLSATTRAGLAYEWLYVGRSPEAPDDIASGTGHRATATVRHDFADALTTRGQLRYYAAVELGLGATYLSDPLVGDRVIGNGVVGIRGGYELFPTAASPSRSFDAYLAVRALPSLEGVGWVFSVGMDWVGH